MNSKSLRKDVKMANNQNNTPEQNNTNELVVRREKLAALKEAGLNPFEITK